MDKRTICLLNDSFPPEIDGVANAVVNYAKNITKSGENAIVVTPTMPGADDSAFPFPVLRYRASTRARSSATWRAIRFHPRPRAC